MIFGIYIIYLFQFLQNQEPVEPVLLSPPSPISGSNSKLFNPIENRLRNKSFNYSENSSDFESDFDSNDSDESVKSRYLSEFDHLRLIGNFRIQKNNLAV